MLQGIDLNLLGVFILLNTLNVIIQTAKSIITINGTKIQASIVNMLAYGFYTIVIIYMVCDLPLMLKALIVGLCNLVGVYFVKTLEQKMRKDKLWKIEVTVPLCEKDELADQANILDLSFNYLPVGKNVGFNFYSYSMEESEKIKKLLDKFNAKYVVFESKTL